jgi:hypothetical protein
MSPPQPVNEYEDLPGNKLQYSGVVMANKLLYLNMTFTSRQGG